MKKKAKKIGGSVIRGLIVFSLAIAVFVTFYFSKAPALFANHVEFGTDDFQWTAYLLLIFFRILLYFSFPFALAFFEWVIFRKQSYLWLLIEYFNDQFGAYSVASGIYMLLALDKGFGGVTIFGSADAFLFIASFVFSLILKQKLPDQLDVEQTKGF